MHLSATNPSVLRQKHPLRCDKMVLKDHTYLISTLGTGKNIITFKSPTKKQQKLMSDRKQQVKEQKKKTLGKQQVALKSNMATIIIPLTY